MLAVLALDRGDRGDLDPAGAVAVDGSPIAVAAALTVPARLGARRSVLAGDVAQALGQFAEGGGTSTPSASLVAALGSPAMTSAAEELEPHRFSSDTRSPLARAEIQCPIDIRS